MNVIQVMKYGEPEVLEGHIVPDPVPGENEVVVRIRAAGINFADILMRLGLYTGTPKPPFVPGLEVAGTIERLGEGVGRKVKRGQWVAALTFGGGYAEKIRLPASQLVPLPEKMSFEDAAALSVNFLTAYQALTYMAHLRKGERLLIHAAAGGMGLAAIQLAKLAGAEIFGTASESKHDFLYQQGVDHAIDYRTEDFEKEVRRLTRGQGVDVILDAVGAQSFRKGYRVLRPGGRLICYGLSAAVTGKGRTVRAVGAWWNTPSFNAMDLIGKNRAVIGVHLGTMGRARPDLVRAWLEELLRLYAAGKIKPHIGKTFPLAEAVAAHHYIHDRRNIGKVLLLPEAKTS